MCGIFHVTEIPSTRTKIKKGTDPTTRQMKPVQNVVSIGRVSCTAAKINWRNDLLTYIPLAFEIKAPSISSLIAIDHLLSLASSARMVRTCNLISLSTSLSRIRSVAAPSACRPSSMSLSCLLNMHIYVYSGLVLDPFEEFKKRFASVRGRGRAFVQSIDNKVYRLHAFKKR